VNWLSILAQGTVVLAAPLILAAIGGLCSERAGIVNIALEGKMLIATIAVFLVTCATHSPMFGLAAGIGSAVLLSLLHFVLTQKYAIDHVVSGMAINAIAFGAANFLDKKYTDPATHEFAHFPLALYWGFALLLPVLMAIYLKQTRGGVRLQAVGSDPAKARQMGLSPIRIRFIGLIWTGVLCGVAGALMVSNVGTYVDNMTAGRGFIALAALIIGGWRPLPAMAACLGFGLCEQLQSQLQGVPVAGLEIPPELWICLPYVVTLVALAGLFGKNRTPAGLGKP